MTSRKPADVIRIHLRWNFQVKKKTKNNNFFVPKFVPMTGGRVGKYVDIMGQCRKHDEPGDVGAEAQFDEINFGKLESPWSLLGASVVGTNLIS